MVGYQWPKYITLVLIKLSPYFELHYISIYASKSIVTVQPYLHELIFTRIQPNKHKAYKPGTTNAGGCKIYKLIAQFAHNRLTFKHVCFFRGSDTISQADFVYITCILKLQIFGTFVLYNTSSTIHRALKDSLKRFYYPVNRNNNLRY